MNSFHFKKEEVDKILESIKKGLNSDKKNIEKAFELDYKEWEYEVDFNKIINEIDFVKEREYLPVFSKEEIVDGIGKICLICNQNPYLIFSFILCAIYTNNKVEVVLENKMLASNKAIIKSIEKVLNAIKLDRDTITYIELTNKDDIISYQDKYDLIYYFGNKDSYISFIKRINIDTKFENFGEVNLYTDSKEFKEAVVEIDKWAYLNEMKINIYNSDIDEAIEEINRLNNTSSISIIFSKNMDKISNFIKNVKSKTIYVNTDFTKDYIFETNLNNLVYKKIVKY